MGLLAFTGLPFIPFITFAITLLVLAIYLGQRQTSIQQELEASEIMAAPGEDDDILQTPDIDAVLVKVGYGLVPFVDEAQGGDEKKRKKRREETKKRKINKNHEQQK